MEKYIEILDSLMSSKKEKKKQESESSWCGYGVRPVIGKFGAGR